MKSIICDRCAGTGKWGSAGLACNRCFDNHKGTGVITPERAEWLLAWEKRRRDAGQISQQVYEDAIAPLNELIESAAAAREQEGDEAVLHIPFDQEFIDGCALLGIKVEANSKASTITRAASARFGRIARLSITIGGEENENN